MYDVCVVGGGPAGAAISQVLSSLDHRVIVVESRTFPRQHIGQSLPPSIWPLLVELHVDGEVAEAKFAKHFGAWVRWGGSLERQTHGGMSRTGIQVDRGRFDSILLDRARAVGAEICQPGLAGVAKRIDESHWSVPVQTPNQRVVVLARHLVDASGRKCWLRVRRKRDRVRTLALYSHWSSTNSDFETRVEAGDDYWFWAAPLAEGRTSVAVFVDHATVRVGSTDAGCDRVERLHDRIIESTLRPQQLVTSRLQSVKCCDATPFLAEAAAGPGWTMIGDAALSLDPLSSQGVQAAVASGIRGAAVVNTCLRLPENSSMAVDFHNFRLREAHASHQLWTHEVYARASQTLLTPFWRVRGFSDVHTNNPQSPLQPLAGSGVRRSAFSLSSILRVSANCELVSMPVLRDYFIERSEVVVARPGGTPFAFVEDVEVAPVVHQVQHGPRSVEELSRWMHAQGCRVEPIRIIGSLITLGILEVA